MRCSTDASSASRIARKQSTCAVHASDAETGDDKSEILEEHAAVRAEGGSRREPRGGRDEGQRSCLHTTRQPPQQAL
eukprot:4577463-Pleurochrysis_carterae.AAC.3